ncbi:hypothetical protein GYH30_037430 [Glycine max]|uniref:Uncharacterized protein n=1 Tax=Glycine max TaxID=3847 RepID=K7M217_SOYBN|nr:hypothetical protein GYH30_037430 [Glycine max]
MKFCISSHHLLCTWLQVHQSLVEKWCLKQLALFPLSVTKSALVLSFIFSLFVSSVKSRQSVCMVLSCRKSSLSNKVLDQIKDFHETHSKHEAGLCITDFVQT